MYYLSDICSLCLVHNKNMKSILSNDTDNIVIEEKLKTFLLEPIHFKPHITKYICNDCLKNLNFIHKFKLSCIENIATLNKYVKKLEVHGPYTNLSITLLTHRKHNKEGALELVNQNNSITCENLKQENYLQDIVLRNEFIKEEIEDTEILFDEAISVMEEKYQIDLPDLKTEIKEDIEILNEDTVSEQELTTVLFNLQEDSLQIKEEKDIIEDSENLASTSTVIENITNIRRNKKNKKRNKKRYKCKECNEVFTYPYQLAGHSRTHITIKEQPYKCPSCPKTFAYIKHLIRHERSHVVYTCGVCSKVFNNKTSLMVHERIHSNIRPFKCRVCDKAFRQNHALIMHMRVHTNEKPYVCDLCGKTYSRYHALFYHQQLHRNIRPYKCDVCNKAFILNSELTKHMRTHTGEKPFKCDVCNRAFSERRILTAHVYIHNNIRPFKCSMCNKAYTRSNDLSIHKRVHTGEKAYKCTMCNKGFTRRSTLIQHEQRVHKNIASSDIKVEKCASISEHPVLIETT